MQETHVQSLGQEDPLEKEMATHSSVFAREIPWREESGGLQYMGSPRVGHDWATEHTHSKLFEHLNPMLCLFLIHEQSLFIAARCSLGLVDLCQ